MSRKDDLSKLIRIHNRRLQKLREKQALSGRSIDPGISIEIEDIESKVKKLATELKNLEEITAPSFSSPTPSVDIGEESQENIKILFLASNPTDTTRLRIDEEIRAIDQVLRQSEFRNKFDIKQHLAVSVFDIQSYLLRHKPDIIHFSGHGHPSSEILLEDSSGKSAPVSVCALSQLFFVLKDNIKCIVLNACYSEPQAQAIAEHIDCVIGMSKAIGDKAAISFAGAFYQALGFGRDVKTAFDLGCVQLNLENLDEQDTPKLIARNKNSEEIVFAYNQ